MPFTQVVSSGNTSSGFWGITTFFNPRRYRRRKLLYDIFRETTKRQGLQLLTVELAFGRAPFELRAGDSEILLRLRADNDGIMWQKERLLNVGLSHLPTECDSVVWLDCDIVFDNPHWVAETAKLLQRYAVVQPFSISVRLLPGQTTTNIQAANDPCYDRRPSSAYNYTYAQVHPLADYMSTGHTGFAWAAHRSVFDDIGFYDKMIVGGGDVVLACGFYGRLTHRFMHLLPTDLINDQQEWIKAISARVCGSVTFTRGGLFHLWHGTPRSRRILSRFHLLTKHSFNPREDIKQTDQGYFVWARGKPKLHKAVARHFWLRNEDGNQFREGISHLADDLGDWRRRWYERLSSHVTRIRMSGELALLAAPGAEEKRMTMIIMNWKRPQMVEHIVAAYSEYAVIGDIVVWNNNPDSPLDLSQHPNLKTVTCKHDAGLDSRWAAGVLADQEHLLIHDDDLLLTETALRLIFRHYLRRPHLCHGICGRNLKDSYNVKDAFGRVDMVLTTCLLIHRRYIPSYFDRVALFDDLRHYGCGNGEDIVMNYVVRSITGQKSRAYRIPYTNASNAPGVSSHSISRRPGHLSVRNQIARRCVEQLTREKANLRIDDYGLDELKRMFPASWARYYEEPEAIIKSENFVLSKSVSREKFAGALSLLCRRGISESELSFGDRP
jgi:hypothetical protein